MRIWMHRHTEMNALLQRDTGNRTMKDIKKQIKDQQFHKVYLLMGEEDYLITQARNLLKDALVRDGDDMNCMTIEESKVDMQMLAESAGTFPFFAEKRVIILDRTGVIASGKDAFLDILKGLPDTTCIIICETKVDKKTKTYKWIKKNEYVREFLKKEQTDRTMLRWIAAMLGKEKKKIREADAACLLERTGNDMYLISNEVSKLISYLGDRDEVKREDIDAICTGAVQGKIFEMIDAIASGDTKKALSCYNDLLLLKEPYMRILFLLIRQYRILLIIKTMRAEHKGDAEIAKEAGIPTFAVKKNASGLSRFTREGLEKSIEWCSRTETEIKTGRIDGQIGLELLIVGLAEGKQ